MFFFCVGPKKKKKAALEHTAEKNQLMADRKQLFKLKAAFLDITLANTSTSNQEDVR